MYSNKELKEEITNKLPTITQKLENFSSNTAGILDVIGTKIEVDKKGSVNQKSLENLAKALEIYSDKRYETARYFFIKNGECIRHVAVSTQTPSSTAIMPDKDFLYKLKDYAEKTDSQIVFCHNHPSGYVEPSKQDIELTEYVQNILNTGNESNKQYFAGHVILDHNTYGIYTPQNQWISVSNGKYYPIEQTPFNYQISKNEYNIQIKKDTDLIKLSDFIKDKINKENEWNKSEWIPIAFTNIHGIVKNVEFISINEFNNQKELQDKLRDIGRENNSENVYFLPYKNNYNQMSLCENFAKQTGLVKDIYFENDMNGFDLSEYSGGNLFPNTIKNEIKIEDTENFTKEEYLSARENNHNKKINEINNKQIQGEKAMSTALPEVKYLSFENNNVFKMGNAKKIDSLREDLINQKLITPEDDVILISASQLKEKGLEIKENIPSVSITIPIDIPNNKYTYENYYSITSYPELLQEKIIENNKEIESQPIAIDDISNFHLDDADEMFNKFQELTNLSLMTQEQAYQLNQINNFCEQMVNKIDISKLTPEQAIQFDYLLRIAMQNPNISDEQKKHHHFLEENLKSKVDEYNREEEIDIDKNTTPKKIEQQEKKWEELIFSPEGQILVQDSISALLEQQTNDEQKKEIIDTISLSSLVDLKTIEYDDNAKKILSQKVEEKGVEFQRAVDFEYLKQVAKYEVLKEHKIDEKDFEELCNKLDRIKNGQILKGDSISKKEAKLLNEVQDRATVYLGNLTLANTKVVYQNKEFLQNAINAVNGVTIHKTIIKDAHIAKETGSKQNKKLKEHWKNYWNKHPKLATGVKLASTMGFGMLKTAAIASVGGTVGLAAYSAYNTVKQINKSYKRFKETEKTKGFGEYLKYLKSDEHRGEAIGLVSQIAATTISGIFSLNASAAMSVVGDLTGRRVASTISSVSFGIAKGINANVTRNHILDDIKSIYSKYNSFADDRTLRIFEKAKTQDELKGLITSMVSTDTKMEVEDIEKIMSNVEKARKNHGFRDASANIAGAAIGLAISSGALNNLSDKITEVVPADVKENLVETKEKIINESVDLREKIRNIGKNNPNFEEITNEQTIEFTKVFPEVTSTENIEITQNTNEISFVTGNFSNENEISVEEDYFNHLAQFEKENSVDNLEINNDFQIGENISEKDFFSENENIIKSYDNKESVLLNEKTNIENNINNLTDSKQNTIVDFEERQNILNNEKSTIESNLNDSRIAQQTDIKTINELEKTLYDNQNVLDNIEKSNQNIEYNVYKFSSENRTPGWDLNNNPFGKDNLPPIIDGKLHLNNIDTTQHAQSFDTNYDKLNEIQNKLAKSFFTKSEIRKIKDGNFFKQLDASDRNTINKYVNASLSISEFEKAGYDTSAAREELNNMLQEEGFPTIEFNDISSDLIEKADFIKDFTDNKIINPDISVKTLSDDEIEQIKNKIEVTKSSLSQTNKNIEQLENELSTKNNEIDTSINNYNNKIASINNSLEEQQIKLYDKDIEINDFSKEKDSTIQRLKEEFENQKITTNTQIEEIINSNDVQENVNFQIGENVENEKFTENINDINITYDDEPKYYFSNPNSPNYEFNDTWNKNMDYKPILPEDKILHLNNISDIQTSTWKNTNRNITNEIREKLINSSLTPKEIKKFTEQDYKDFNLSYGKELNYLMNKAMAISEFDNTEYDTTAAYEELNKEAIEMGYNIDTKDLIPKDIIKTVNIDDYNISISNVQKNIDIEKSLENVIPNKTEVSSEIDNIVEPEQISENQPIFETITKELDKAVINSSVKKNEIAEQINESSNKNNDLNFMKQFLKNSKRNFMTKDAEIDSVIQETQGFVDSSIYNKKAERVNDNSVMVSQTKEIHNNNPSQKNNESTILKESSTLDLKNLPSVKYYSSISGHEFSGNNVDKIDDFRKNLIKNYNFPSNDDVALVPATYLVDNNIPVKDDIPSVVLTTVSKDENGNKVFNKETYYSPISFPDISFKKEIGNMEQNVGQLENTENSIVSQSIFNKDSAYVKYQEVPEFGLLNDKTNTIENISNARFLSLNDDKTITLVQEQKDGTQKKITIPEVTYQNIIKETEIFLENTKDRPKDSLSYILQNEQYRDALNLGKSDLRVNTAGNFQHNFRVLCEKNPNLGFSEIMDLADKELTQKMDNYQKNQMNKLNKQYPDKTAMLYRRIYDNNFVESSNISKNLNYEIGQNIKLNLIGEQPNNSYLIKSISKNGSYILYDSKQDCEFRLSKKEFNDNIKKIEKQAKLEYKKKKEVNYYER